MDDPALVVWFKAGERAGRILLWTDEQRKTYKRPGGAFPSDVTDAEWAVLGPLILDATPGGRSRKTDMRSAMSAMLFLLRTGCPWRYLPRDGFPPRSTVYNIFRKFQADGTWASISDRLHPMRTPTARAAETVLAGFVLA